MRHLLSDVKMQLYQKNISWMITFIGLPSPDYIANESNLQLAAYFLKATMHLL